VVESTLEKGSSRPSPIRAVIYARVSTANNGQDPTMQTREIREFCGRRGWAVSSEYVDVGVSGAKDSRPELNRLVADAHRRRFDAVVVWRFDRFARSVSHLLRALEGHLILRVHSHSDRNVGFQPRVNSDEPTQRTRLSLLASCDY
jgi:DNA invertase Pin-like site-specific DNA recombinase